MKILIVKKKTLFVIIAVLLFVSIAVCVSLGYSSHIASNPSDQKVIVLDAGHGGIDYGVISKSGIKESEFNLSMTLQLKALLEEAGFKIVLTRDSAEGLYGNVTKNRKRADMEARKKIIVDSKPDLVISIHANLYPSSDRRGAQIFFDEYNDEGETLARNIQTNVNILNKEYINRDFAALKGDYYLLKCSHVPSAIVECGFLSNIDDEKLLSDESYCKRMAFCIYSGIVGYFETIVK